MTSSPTPAPLSRAAVREVDRRATLELGMPGVVLMENAAHGAAEEARGFLRHRPGTTWIFCGPGNNGGDGYAMARWFVNFGAPVELISFCDPERTRGDAAVMRGIAARLGIPDHLCRDSIELDRLALRLAEAPLIVDALLGTGAVGEVRAPFDHAIRMINAARATQCPRVVAVDLPSGLDADTGVPASTTVRADLTVTFVAPKLGFSAAGASAYTGEVQVVEIGVPEWLVDAVRGSTR
ncbi:MAG: NAD(P)H-hydrate epimerase [Planctomycetes bacterium]|nr:NAD(P)H-hydrate epimerase [Planctomycetota bacterium]MCB9905982.1 NAD(P)H-hydrate epimerase [Planctomycetota bacterium]